MSPDLSAPGRRGLAAWPDLIAVGIVLMTTFALILPAIDGSRLQSRVGFVPEWPPAIWAGVGAVRPRARRRLEPLGFRRAADHGGPVRVGIAQGAPRPPTTGRRAPTPGWPRRGCTVGFPFGRAADHFESPESVAPGSFFAAERLPRRHNPLLIEQSPSSDLDSAFTDWPGTWRDGMTDGPRIAPLATAAFLADAPSVDLPGQVPEGHGGQGRNLFFEDGHVDFVPVSAPRDPLKCFCCRGNASRRRKLGADHPDQRPLSQGSGGQGGVGSRHLAAFMPICGNNTRLRS